MKDALEELGKKGGIMDADDEMDIVANPNLARDLITDPALNVNNPNNPALSAGMTFLGQFLDHDMTFDPTSSLERQVDPEAIRNFRNPLFELDNMYGSAQGPPRTSTTRALAARASSSSWKKSRRGGGLRWWFRPLRPAPQQSEHRAPRGSAQRRNLIVSQLHTSMLRFHNAVVDHVKSNLGSRTQARCSPGRSAWCAGITSGSSSTIPRKDRRQTGGG